MKLFLLAIFKLVTYNSVNCISDDFGSVIFVNLLWRHGERTPVTFNANDPYQDEKFWPEGIGELTNTGKRQHYELGQWLRQRYNELLTPEYSPDRVYVRSTDKDRTLMSAQVNLLGMYPPQGRQLWNKRLPWQPVAVHTVPEDLDNVLVSDPPCPAYYEEFERVYKSEEISQIFKKYQDVVDVVRENAGDDKMNFKYLHDTWDTLNIEQRNNYDIPKWAKAILPRLDQIGQYRFLIETWTKKMARIKSGLLIREMIENMKNRTEERNNRVVNIYSAHDTTIANLLHSMGLYNSKTPPLASCVMLELRKDHQGRHFVSIFYRYSTTEKPELLTIEGCSPFCPLEQFIKFAQPLIPEDWDKECNL